MAWGAKAFLLKGQTVRMLDFRQPQTRKIQDWGPQKIQLNFPCTLFVILSRLIRVTNKSLIIIFKGSFTLKSCWEIDGELQHMKVKKIESLKSDREKASPPSYLQSIWEETVCPLLFYGSEKSKYLQEYTTHLLKPRNSGIFSKEATKVETWKFEIKSNFAKVWDINLFSM